MNQYMEIGLEAFRKAWDEEVAEFPEGRPVRSAGKPTKAAPNGEDAAWWQQQGPAFLQSWITWRQNNPSLHILRMEDGSPAIELPVVAQVQAGDDLILLKGYIDRVFVDSSSGQLLIVDLKTGRTTPTPLQLAFYRRAMKEHYGMEAQYGAYWMARQGTISDVVDLSTYTDQTIDHLVAQTYAGVKAGVFLPNVTALCKGCGVKEHCFVFNPNARFSPINTRISEVTEVSDV